MKYYEDYKPSNYLNEYSYEQIKRTNQIALDILNEFVDEMFIMFLNIKTYIVKPYKLIDLLNDIKSKGNYNYRLVEYCLGLSVDEQIEKSNGTIETYRYYYKKDGIVIHSLIYYKESLLKNESKKMLKYLTAEGQKEREKIRSKSLNKLKQLQDELFDLIDNDPTINILESKCNGR